MTDVKDEDILHFAGGKIYDTLEEINSFIEGQEIDVPEGRQEFNNVRAIRAGRGEYSFNYNNDGFYIGADSIDDAKLGYRYDNKELFIKDGTFTLYDSGVKAVEIKDNSIHVYNDGEIIIGDNKLKMEVDDGHGRIIINDGTNDRIILGYLQNKF